VDSFAVDPDLDGRVEIDEAIVNVDAERASPTNFDVDPVSADDARSPLARLVSDSIQCTRRASGMMPRWGTRTSSSG